jgi:hypothetical protein
VLTPAPDMVIVAVLADMEVLAAYVTVIVAFPFPVAVFTLNHEASSVMVHEMFELIMNCVLPAAASTLISEGATVSSEMPFCVTVTCCEGTPVDETVIVAVLAVAEVFAV